MKTTIIYTVGAVVVLLCELAIASVPEITAANMSQSSQSRLVTITYTLENAPAVVTLDVQTNAADNTWVSIGGEAVCSAKGDVWKKVGTANETFNGVITWHPELSWPDHKIAEGGARAVVTAWALDNTPAYMVVDISENAIANSQTYYPSVEFLPGGVLSNAAYRTTLLLMRKIMAKDMVWTMGSTAFETGRNPDTSRQPDEATHQVMLTNNYYIGVFEVTQTQWGLVQTNYPAPSTFSSVSYRAMRPVESVCYNEIRMAANSTSVSAGAEDWPGAPCGGSFLGVLRQRTGIDFDLPSEAQWEFAARAGNGDTFRGDGSAILNSAQDANMAMFGRYQYNGGWINGTVRPSANSNPSQSECSTEYGTAVVGSYKPNNYGLYDTCGNVYEWCLDWYAVDISPLSGSVNTIIGTTKVFRGGAFANDANYCRPALRRDISPSTRSYSLGFRVACRAGLQ